MMISNDLPTSPEETAEELNAREKLAESYASRELALTKEQEEFIRTKLSSKLWRLNNLYTIRDKNNVKLILKLNKAQEKVVVEHRHKRKIILKSRQQGISTLFLAYYLDDVLFKPGFQAGIQSYGQDEAAKLQKRAELMWEELDQNIKDMLGLKLVSNNQKGMTFSNGAILKIGNFRGDTLQGLHVSELGKIAKRYPEKAKELKTGAFQAVSSGNSITIESTAEGQTGLFYEMWVKATQKKELGKKLTPLDFQPIFLSWLEDPDCQMGEHYDVEEYHQEYIDKLEKELGITLTIQQINWLCGKLDELGDDFDQEYPATPERAFRQSVEGTYFHHQYRRLLDSNRIRHAPYQPGEPVHVSFDLGMNDEMVLLFCQVINGVPYLVNEYHNTGQALEFYVDVLRSLDYEYGWFILPHDANVRDLSSGMTRIETLRQLGLTKIKLLERIPFMDSINAARNLMKYIVVNDKCENTVLAIQNYRKKYDRQLGVYLTTDVHDIHSNYMASLRYLAQGLGYYSLKEKPKKQISKRVFRGSNFKQFPQNSFAV